MVESPVARDIPVELALGTDAGPITYLGELLDLVRTEASVRLAPTPCNDPIELEPPFLDIYRDRLPVAVVIKGTDGSVIDIIPASVGEIAVEEDGSPRVFLRLGREVHWTEQRAVRRMPCHLPVVFNPVAFRGRNLPPTGKQGQGHIVELSAKGARLTTPLQLPVGLRLELRFEVQGQTRNLTAEIVNDQGGTRLRRYGLSFVTKAPGKNDRR